MFQVIDNSLATQEDHNDMMNCLSKKPLISAPVFNGKKYHVNEGKSDYWSMIFLIIQRISLEYNNFHPKEKFSNNNKEKPITVVHV